jgi:hypothetical protein
MRLDRWNLPFATLVGQRPHNFVKLQIIRPMVCRHNWHNKFRR